MVSRGTFCPPNHPHISQPSIKQLIWKRKDPRNPKEWQPQTIKISKGLGCNKNETRYLKNYVSLSKIPSAAQHRPYWGCSYAKGLKLLSSPVCNWTRLRYPEVKPFHLSGKKYSELGGWSTITECKNVHFTGECHWGWIQKRVIDSYYLIKRLPSRTYFFLLGV